VIELHILGEGYTEEAFVKELLIGHLANYGIKVVASIFVTKFDEDTGRLYKGGISNYQKVKSDIVRRLSSDRRDNLRVSTMIDFYGLPADFPSYYQAYREEDPYKRVEILEAAFAEDIGDSRFIPYLSLHEFEALIFSDPGKLGCVYFNNDKQIDELVALSQEVNPELINDDAETCPSKRIKKAIRSYNKRFAGSRVAKAIGLNRIRSRCKHFDEWIGILEVLATAGGYQRGREWSQLRRQL
jgi:hypothetical protein